MTKPIQSREIADLLDQYAATLEFYASQWTASPEDCVQEAFVALAGLTKPPDNVVAWLFCVVRNRALNHSRSQRRRTTREKLAARPNADQLDPSSKIEIEDERAKLLEVLDDLSASDRELVVLRIWSGLSWQEIAAVAGSSSSTAQRKYVVALEKMKERLETKCPTNPN